MIDWPEITQPATAAAALPICPPAARDDRPDPDPLICLPDGRELRPTIAVKCIYVRITRRATVTFPEEAMLLLYLSSPDFDSRRNWQAPVPDDEFSNPAAPGEVRPDDEKIKEKALAWAEANFSPEQFMDMWGLGVDLWIGAHATRVDVVDDGKEADSEQKKSRESSPTGVSSMSASSAEGTSPRAATSSTGSRSGTPTRASTHGVSSRASSASPRRSGKRDSSTRKP